MSQLLYRGLPYDRNIQDSRPSDALDHVYRGHHFLAPLQHRVPAVDPAREFHYRGHIYRHQQAAQA